MSLIRRIKSLIKRDKLSSELDEELRYHVAMREEMNVREGLTREEAHLSARRRFGNFTLLKEKTREADLLVFVESALKDLGFGMRMLGKHPGFTALAVAALAVGIGANTAVFTASKAVLFQPLDAERPREMVNVYRTTANDRYIPSFSYRDFEYYQQHCRSLSGLVATSGAEVTLSSAPGALSTTDSVPGGIARTFGFRFPSVVSGGGSQFVSAAVVSENYFGVLGLNALLGRVFREHDADDLEKHPAILMSENFWQQKFGGDPSIVGKTVKLNGEFVMVIGITPHDWVGTVINVPNIWIPVRVWPLVAKNPQLLTDQENRCCTLYGRLAAGISREQAQAEMTLLERQVARLHVSTNSKDPPASITLEPGSHVGPFAMLGGSGLALSALLILGAVGLVLLIACANVGSLQLARSVARQKEIGVRLSIGASRARVIRQFLTESALLGLIAGCASLLMTWWVLRLLMLQIAAALPLEWGSLALHLTPDIGIFSYVFCLSLLASVLFGLAPALQSSRPDLSAALKEQGSGLFERISTSRMRDLLIGAQAAACLFLMILAGLCIHGSIRSMTLNPGFETLRAMSVEVMFPKGFGYTHAKQMFEFQQLRERVRESRIVASEAVGVAPDGGGLRTAAVGLNGSAAPTTRDARTIFYSYVSSDYFTCLGIPFLSGGTFARDSLTPQPTAILSESAAEDLWPGENPIGRRLALDASNQFHVQGEFSPQRASYEVIAVVKDTRTITPQGGDNRKAYLPIPADRLDGSVPMLIRFTGEPTAMFANLQREVKNVDPNVVVYASTLEDLLTSTPTFVITRLAALFASLVGFLGLALACVGIYGTVSYAVVRRTREVGIRMSLGASKHQVLRMIVFESCRPVIAGLLIGIVAAIGASRVINSILFGIGVVDPVVFLGVAFLFLAIALSAATVPAWKATKVDPMLALRCE